MSGHFPTLHSILAVAPLVDALETAYGLPVTRCRLIKSVLLDTYHVATGDGPYILRIYPHGRRSRAEIEAELDFLDYLDAHQIPVSVAVPQENGERLLALNAPEGTRYAALFTFAPGRALQPDQQPAAVNAFGALIARIHILADGMTQALPRPALDLPALLDRPLQQLEPVLDHRPGDLASLHDAARTIRPVIAALPTEPPWYGLCHGDVSGGNAHVGGDGRLTLFDFDFCGPGWRAYDVATFLIDESDAVQRAFLAGYESARPLHSQERDAVPAFQAAQNIWMLGTRARLINQIGTTHFTDPFITRVLVFIAERVRKIAA